MGIVRPAGPMPEHASIATASPTRCSSSTRGAGSATRSSGRCGTARATTSSSRSGRPGGSTRTRGRRSGCSTSSAPSEIEPPKRYRNDYGQLLEHAPYSQRDIHAPARSPPRSETGEFVVHVRVDRTSPPTTTATTRSTSSAGTATCGRSASTSTTSSRSRAASTSRRRSTRRSRARNFVVCSFVPAQVRLPPARDPGPVQPLEHQLRRGHLLRGRQLHEPARRGDRVVHAPPGGYPARPASGHGRGIHRHATPPRNSR